MRPRSRAAVGTVPAAIPGTQGPSLVALPSIVPSRSDLKWKSKLRELLEFKQRHGHFNVPRNWQENPSLSFWVINQRRLIQKGSLPKARLEVLERFGIQWQNAEGRTRKRDSHWNRLCEALHAFLRERGHCDVPEGWKENPELARWVARQRHLKRRGQLREDRLLRFEECGIDWSLAPRRSRTRDRIWDRMYYALKEFTAAHGHCRVPKNWPAHPKLARWVPRQRFLLRRQLLQPDRRLRLGELGFSLTAAAPPSAPQETGRTIILGERERVWREHYEALVRYRASEGHSNVPRRYTRNPSLARWVSHQRELQKDGRLSAEHMGLLDQLQFPWSGIDGLECERATSWEETFSRLALYRQKYGHCDVPARHADDPSLGRWVAAQRVLHRQGRLKPDRVKDLSSLGFRWRAR